MINNALQESVEGLALKIPSNAIGNDIVFLPEFKKSCTSQFIKRVYTKNEIAYCDQFSGPMLRYASTWAAKEAVYKVLKQINPDISISWRSIEINREKPSGKPSAAIKNQSNTFNIYLTLSHDGDYVWAIALAATESSFAK